MGRRFELDGVEYEVDHFTEPSFGGLFARKVEQVKPYFTNAPEAEPEVGDVWRTHNYPFITMLMDNGYWVTSNNVKGKIGDAGYVHTPGHSYRRVLLVRGGRVL